MKMISTRVGPYFLVLYTVSINYVVKSSDLHLSASWHMKYTVLIGDIDCSSVKEQLDVL